MGAAPLRLWPWPSRLSSRGEEADRCCARRQQEGDESTPRGRHGTDARCSDLLTHEDFADLASSLLRQFGVRSFSAESQGGRAALEIKSMNSWRTHVLPHAKVKDRFSDVLSFCERWSLFNDRASVCPVF